MSLQITYIVYAVFYQYTSTNLNFEMYLRGIIEEPGFEQYN